MASDESDRQVFPGDTDADESEIIKYWEDSIPWAFDDKPEMSFEEKREMRYEYQDFMHEVFEFENYTDQHVVEIGCGAGIDSIEFARNGATVTAIDPTANAVDTTRDHFQERGETGKVVQASGDDLPLESDSVDHVYSFGVLHHIPDVDAVMAEIDRILKPDGTFSGMVYNEDSLLNAYSIIYKHGIKNGGLADHTPTELASLYSERGEGCPYTKLYTKRDVLELFDGYFEQVELDVVYDVIDTEDRRKVKLDVPDEYDLGWFITIHARK
jgi:ubiquinone/menaquinone biosynthesis C-methylase UbiE